MRARSINEAARALLALSLAACGRTELATDAAPLSDADAAQDAAIGADGCADAGSPPATLRCTGLYADLATKTVAPGVRAYAPAASLWADGADKSRFIALPGPIDDSDPNEWVFPVGTKVWKEFRVGGKRIETRLFEKERADRWVYAAYVWNDDESQATQSFGAEVPVAGGRTHHVPSPDECEMCHRGRRDRVLGFDAVGLGLGGAIGTTLDDLARDGLLAPPPSRTHLVIGDDGTGMAAGALPWLHANCGVTCHDDNPNAVAYGAGMRLRLDATTLDGRPASSLAPEVTTIGVAATTPSWAGQRRIVAGDPSSSLLAHLVSTRGAGDQMPPIATTAVDAWDAAAIRAWIAALPQGGAP